MGLSLIFREPKAAHSFFLNYMPEEYTLLFVGFVCGDMKDKYSQFVVIGIERNVSTDVDFVM